MAATTWSLQDSQPVWPHRGRHLHFLRNCAHSQRDTTRAVCSTSSWRLSRVTGAKPDMAASTL
jgi:hypothetical protein